MTSLGNKITSRLFKRSQTKLSVLVQVMCGSVKALFSIPIQLEKAFSYPLVHNSFALLQRFSAINIDHYCYRTLQKQWLYCVHQ